MEKYTKWIFKFKKPLMVLFVLINLTAIYGITRIKIGTEFDIFKTQNSQYAVNLETLNAAFPSSDEMIVVCEYDEALKEAILDFEDAARSLDGIKLVKGIEETDNALPISVEAISPIKTVNGTTYAVITLFPKESFGFSELKEMEQTLKDAGLTYYISGDKYMQNKIFDYLLIILLAILPFAIIILFNIFRVQMKSIKATILSVLPAVIAALWTLGFAGLLGNKVSVLTVLAPIFTIIIGSADGLHFNSHVQEYLDEKNSMQDSIAKTLRMVGVPMIITTVTSVAGFISLLFMNTAAIHDLAVYTSIGIALAGIITFVFLPTINSFDKIDITKKKASQGINLPFEKLMGWPSYLILVAIVVCAFFGIPKIKTEFNQLMLYKDYTAVSKNFDKVMEVNEGTIPMFALIENGGNPMDAVVAEEADAFSEALLDSGEATKVVSLYTVLASIREEMPQGMQVDAAMLTGTDIYSEMVSDEYSKIMIFPKDLNNATIEGIVKTSEGYDNIMLSGTQLMMYELNQQMLGGQVTSLLIAFGLVLLSLILSLRKLWISLLSMLPILFTSLFMFAFLGLTGISLNLFTTTMFSVTIGVGIDYAIHFTSVYNQYKREGLASDQAVENAYAFSSRPIIANALGFAMGLSVLMLSPLKIHLYVSLLMWVSMVLSSTLSLSFLPTVLKKAK